MLDTHASRNRADRVLNESLKSLLVSGGDGRMTVQPYSGLNAYGTAPHIRDAVPFGSCTASSPIRLGLEGARAFLERMRLAARSEGEPGVDTEIQALFDECRARLLDALHLDRANIEVAFCPSGTDAEFLALALLRAENPQAVVNIISAPSEVGGGTTHAASGRYFNHLVPAGGERTVGDPIDDELGRLVRIRTIDLRTDEGYMRESKLLDDIATRQVEETLAAGARPLLHVVAHTKTGAHVPSLECVEALRARFGRKLAVMVDAAQGRVSRRGLKECAAKGYLVMFTGSKFYGGPPFSGALFVPPELWPQNTGLASLSPGCTDFFTAPEMPQEWDEVRSSLPDTPNLGLALRWGAAIAQIEAYYACAPNSRLEVLRTWETVVPEEFGRSRMIELFPVEPLHDPDVERLLESKITVFPFFLRPSKGSVPLPKSTLTRVFQWINRDISGLLPDLDEAQKAVLAREIHVGQPVLLTGEAERERSVLRIALGAPLITRVAEDPRLGPTLEHRKAWLRTQVQICRRKLELIVEHLDLLLEQDPR